MFSFCFHFKKMTFICQEPIASIKLVTQLQLIMRQSLAESNIQIDN